MEPVVTSVGDSSSLTVRWDDDDFDILDKKPQESNRKEIEDLSSRFTNSSEKDKPKVLAIFLNKSANNTDYLQFTIETKEIFDLFKSKCKQIYSDEYVFFIEKCFNFFKDPAPAKAMEIVSKHINPFSMQPVNIRNSQQSYENMCKLLKSYEQNEEKISKNLRSYLKEILLNMSIQFSVSQ